MPALHAVPTDLQNALRDAVARNSTREVANQLRLHHSAVTRAVTRGVAAPSTIERLVELRRGAKVKQAADFAKSAVAAAPPRGRRPGNDGWTLDSVRQARDLQAQGKFAKAVELAAAMRCDDALWTAITNRSAPQSAVAARLEPAKGTRGAAIQKHALESIVCPRAVLKNIHATLADHGIAVGHNVRLYSDDGTEVGFHHNEWPLEHVEWDAFHQQLFTRTADMVRVPIVHGDGEWVVYRKSQREGWRYDAAILPGALVFAAHMLGIKGWSGSVDAHGTPRVEGQLPDGLPIRDADGVLTKEAAAYLEMLSDAMSGETNAFVSPSGAKTNWVTSGSSAWQVFSELVTNREKAAARIYLGTDGVLGASGGAPGVDITALFGVATTIVQADLDAIEEGLFTGLYVPWTAVNYGDSRLAPRLRYQLPDSDADKQRESKSKARDQFFSAVENYKKNGFVVTQDVVNRLAADLGVDAPELNTEGSASSLMLAPTDVAKVVKVKEAREAQGLPPFNDDRDELTLTQLESWVAPGSGTTPSPGPQPSA